MGPSRDSDVALFCLVHSSVQGPSGWARLFDALVRRGHAVVAPDLGAVDPESNAATYAERIVSAIDEQPRPLRDAARIVAHSASGMFLPWTAKLAGPERLTSIVYLAAYVPAPRQSLLSSFQDDPSMFNPDWVGKNPMDDAVAAEFLFHDCSAAVLPWALSTRRLTVARGAMSEYLPDDLAAEIPAQFIACRDDRTLAPDWMRQASRERLGIEPIEIDGGHCPQVSRPEELADMLVSI